MRASTYQIIIGLDGAFGQLVYQDGNTITEYRRWYVTSDGEYGYHDGSEINRYEQDVAASISSAVIRNGGFVRMNNRVIDAIMTLADAMMSVHHVAIVISQRSIDTYASNWIMPPVIEKDHP